MFYFLELPRELRNTLYRLYIEDAGPFIIGRAHIRYQDLDDEGARVPEKLGNEKHALSYVCRMVQEEYHQELGLTKAERYELMFCPPRVSCYMAHEHVEKYSETVDLGVILGGKSSNEGWMRKQIHFMVDLTRASDSSVLPGGASASVVNMCTKHAKEQSNPTTISLASFLLDDDEASSGVLISLLLWHALVYLQEKHAGCKTVHLQILFKMHKTRAEDRALWIYKSMLGHKRIFSRAVDDVHVQIVNRSGPKLHGRLERQADRSFLTAQHEWR